MGKSLKVWTVILLLMVLGAEFMLPSVLSELLASSLRKKVASDSVTVEVSGRPAVLMLGGHFKHLAVTAQNAKLDKIAFHELNADFKDVQLDISALFKKEVMLKAADSVSLVATITQEDIARYINANVKGAKDAQVFITPQGVRVASRLSLGSIATLDVNLDGQIVCDGEKIKFKTEKFAVNNTIVGNFSSAALTEIALFDLKKMPFGVTVRDIQLGTGEVKIYADNLDGRI